MNVLDLVTTATANYLPYLSAYVASLTRAGVYASDRLRLTILHRGIDARGRNVIETAASGSHEIRWFDCTRANLRETGAPVGLADCPPHYMRLAIPHVLRDARRAAYMDVDTVVAGPLQPLMSLDLGAHVVGAVTDLRGTMKRVFDDPARIGLDPEAPYFNSGVLVMDLEGWRERGVAARTLAAYEDHAELAAAQRQFDQLCLNVVFHRGWQRISSRWNHFSESPAHEAPRVVHFLGNGRPGSPTCRPEFTRLFERALHVTPYRGWWPSLRA